MLFNSIEYLVFFPLVAVLYFVLPVGWRMGWLLCASYWFYLSWKMEYGLLILGVSLLNYGAGRMLETETRRTYRRSILGGALLGSFGCLLYFKYANFLLENMGGWVGCDWGISVILPVGISFFTFQAASYTLDVYRGELPTERDPWRFLLFVRFFPQLVAGPIERAGHLLGQMHGRHRPELDNLRAGLTIILIGLFKKMVIADRLAVYVSDIYGDNVGHSGSTLWLANYFFAFQIYCDFSGYSDIAVGSARILGVKLMENFRRPYLAASIREFWGRWHISLSTWFRDYVYLPLGGSRVPPMRWSANILIVFLVSGLWHGANWTFLVWGGLHGIYYLVGRIFDPLVRILGASWDAWPVRALRVASLFHLVVLAWVYFRSPNLAQANEMVARMLSGSWGRPYLGSSSTTFGISMCLIGLLVAWETILEAKPGMYPSASATWPRAFRWATQIGLILLLACLGKSSHEFIYFQF